MHETQVARVIPPFVYKQEILLLNKSMRSCNKLGQSGFSLKMLDHMFNN